MSLISPLHNFYIYIPSLDFLSKSTISSSHLACSQPWSLWTIPMQLLLTKSHLALLLLHVFLCSAPGHSIMPLELLKQKRPTMEEPVDKCSRHPYFRWLILGGILRSYQKSSVAQTTDLSKVPLHWIFLHCYFTLLTWPFMLGGITFQTN